MILDGRRNVWVDGVAYYVTPQQAKIVQLLLDNDVVKNTQIEDELWDIEVDEPEAPWTTIRTHISRIRKNTPLKIVGLTGGLYYLDMEMTEKRPQEIDQALGRIKSDFEEGALRDLDLKPGPREYSGNTGKIKASNDKIEVEFTVKPKETTSGS